MSKTNKMRKIVKILIPVAMMAAVFAAMLAIPCAASGETGAAADTGLTGALETAMVWMAENPEAVLASVITGIAGGVNLAGGVSNRKTRRSITRESAALQVNSGKINNNAVELADKVKNAASDMVAAVSKTVGEAIKALGTEMGKIVNAIERNTEEVRALKRETAANSHLLREMFKDARMTDIRKAEILRGYEEIKNSPEANEDIKGGDGAHEGDDQA